MSWAGHRPFAPDSSHPFAYNNHGIMYVSADDLFLSRTLTFGGVALFALGWIFDRISKARIGKGR